MTQISKRVLDKGVKEDLFDSLYSSLGNLKSNDKVKLFLETTLTETERIMIAKRLVAAFLIRHNVEQNEISNLLKLTPATISKFRMFIKLNSSGFDLIFNELEKRKNQKLTKQILFKILNYAIRAASGDVQRITNIKGQL